MSPCGRNIFFKLGPYGFIQIPETAPEADVIQKFRIEHPFDLQRGPGQKSGAVGIVDRADHYAVTRTDPNGFRSLQYETDTGQAKIFNQNMKQRFVFTRFFQTERDIFTL